MTVSSAGRRLPASENKTRFQKFLMTDHVHALDQSLTSDRILPITIS
jgi:hypothetical protein